MKKIGLILAVALAACIAVSACGYKEGVVINDQKTYLWFTGDTKDVTVVVDGELSFDLGPTYYKDSQGRSRTKKSPTYYEVEPGKHTIVLKREGRVILERTLLLGNGMAREIEVP